MVGQLGACEVLPTPLLRCWQQVVRRDDFDGTRDRELAVVGSSPRGGGLCEGAWVGVG